MNLDAQFSQCLLMVSRTYITNHEKANHEMATCLTYPA